MGKAKMTSKDYEKRIRDLEDTVDDLKRQRAIKDLEIAQLRNRLENIRSEATTIKVIT